MISIVFIIIIIIIIIFFYYKTVVSKSLKGWWMLNVDDLSKYELKLFTIVVLDYNRKNDAYFAMAASIDKNDTFLYFGVIEISKERIKSISAIKGDKTNIEGKLVGDGDNIRITTDHISGLLNRSAELSKGI